MKNRKTRWAVPVLCLLLWYVIAGYILYIYLAQTGTIAGQVVVVSLFSFWPFWWPFCFALLVFIANLVFVPIAASRSKDTYDFFFQKAALLLKLALVPVAVVLYIYFRFFLTIASLVADGWVRYYTQLLWAGLYLVILPGSLYGLAGISAARRNGMLPQSAGVIPRVIMFLPGLDILALLILFTFTREQVLLKMHGNGKRYE